jgi:hypothetical protein
MTSAFAISPAVYQQLAMPAESVHAVHQIFAAANAIQGAQEQLQ